MKIEAHLENGTAFRCSCNSVVFIVNNCYHDLFMECSECKKHTEISLDMKLVKRKEFVRC